MSHVKIFPAVSPETAGIRQVMAWGDLSDIARMVNFLCSSEANYVTRAKLNVDRGWRAR